MIKACLFRAESPLLRDAPKLLPLLLQPLSGSNILPQSKHARVEDNTFQKLFNSAPIFNAKQPSLLLFSLTSLSPLFSLQAFFIIINDYYSGLSFFLSSRFLCRSLATFRSRPHNNPCEPPPHPPDTHIDDTPKKIYTRKQNKTKKKAREGGNRSPVLGAPLN